MIRLNIKRMVQLRGFSHPLEFLRSIGMPDCRYRRLRDNPKTISFELLDRLCWELHCTPNDLMEWLPSASTPINEHQPLDKLRRNNLESPLHVALLGVPISKIDEAMAYLQQLGEKE